MMAGADYRRCDVCGGKAFYDADLSYEQVHKVDGKWVYPDEPYKTAGHMGEHDSTALGRLGDWSVICIDCAKTHRTAILPLLPDNAEITGLSG